MGTAKKAKNAPTDKGRFSRLLQSKASGAGSTQIPNSQKPVRTMAALQELGLAGRRELQARYFYTHLSFNAYKDDSFHNSSVHKK